MTFLFSFHSSLVPFLFWKPKSFLYIFPLHLVFPRNWESPPPLFIPGGILERYECCILSRLVYRMQIREMILIWRCVLSFLIISFSEIRTKKKSTSFCVSKWNYAFIFLLADLHFLKIFILHVLKSSPFSFSSFSVQNECVCTFFCLLEYEELNWVVQEKCFVAVFF